MNKQTAESILAKNIRAYQKIQAHFSQTRYKPWPEFALFKEYIRPGMSILDAGSGNSRLFSEIQNLGIRYTAIDNNASFIEHALARFGNHPSRPVFMVADLRSLPFPDASFDVVFCIAALYHIPSRTFREQAVNEIARVLKPNGVTIMLNWNLWQGRFWKYHLRAIPQLLKREWDIGDCWIPWKNPQGEVQAERYGHAFTKREMRKLFYQAHLTVTTLEFTHHRRGSGGMTANNLLSIARKSAPRCT